MARIGSERVGTVSWAAAAPMLCVAHCLAAPVLLVVAPALAENHTLEAALMGISAAIALLVVWTGSRRHGESQVWLPVVGGLVFWICALAVSGAVGERVLTVIGGALLAGGLFWNARLRHRTTCDACRSYR